MLDLENTISALKYIAGSPAAQFGGFDPQTVEVAKSAIRYLEKLMERETTEKELEAIREARKRHDELVRPRKIEMKELRRILGTR